MPKFKFEPDTIDSTKLPPVVCVYGEPKVGKSTMCAQAFPNYCWITTSQTGFDFVKRERAMGNALSLPENSMTLNTLSSMKSDYESTYAEVKAIIDAWCAGELPGDGLGFDEWSTILQRCYADIQKKNAGNAFRAIDELKAFSQAVCEAPRKTKRGLVLISHSQDPKYVDDDGPDKGKLLYPGGPKVPIGTLVREITQAMDAVVHVVVDGVGVAAKRRILVGPDPAWIRGLRGRVSAAKTEDTDLRKLLMTAGFNLEPAIKGSR